jgi:hypothetical protein
MNFIAAEEIGENCTDSDFKINVDTQNSILLDSNQYCVSDCNNNDEGDLDELLGSGNSKEVYVSPNGTGEGSSYENPSSFKNALDSLQDNTIIHMTEGSYTITSNSYPITLQNKNNITIMAENAGNVMLNSAAPNGKILFKISSSSNITFKDITFSGGLEKEPFNIIKSNGVFFETCTFINYTATSDLFGIGSSSKEIYLNYCNIINSSIKNQIMEVYGDSEVLINNCIVKNNNLTDADTKYTFFKLTKGKLIIKDCEFINNAGTELFKTTKVDSGVINISSCEFRDNKCDIMWIVSSDATLIYENTVNAKYSIYTTVGKIYSPTTLTILNNTQLTATSGDVINITAVLVDDMGNYINIPKLDFSIDGVTYSATYKDGVYSVAYTVPEVTQPEEISFDSTPESTYLGDLTVKYQPLFLLAKPALNMTMSNVSDSVYGDNVTVKVNISNLESGNLVYEFIKDNVVVKTVTDSFSNNMSTVSVNDLPAGDYTVAVKYAEDDNFGATTITKTFTVSKANSTVQILIDPTIPVGDNITVQAVVPANAGGNVTFRLNTDNKTVNVTDKAVFDALANGTYIIYAVYNGDDNYNPSEESNITFEVVKVNPTISIEYSTPVINENVTVTVTMNEDINGDVNVIINKLDPVVEHVVNGTLVFNITNVPYGPQNITVSFTGNDKYNAGEKNASFFVNKLDVDLRISAVAITYGEPLVVIVNANEKFTGEVIVKIGTLNQTVNVVNGKGNATFNNLTADDYFINATFTEDETFYADSANTTATVKGVEVPADTALNINVPANSKSPTFSIKLDKDATGNFTVTVDGKVIDTKELKDGAASITVADLPAGDHNITISYSGDGKYAPIVQNTTLTIKEPIKPTPKVTKKATKIVAKKKTFKAKVKVKKYTITLKSGKTLLKKVKVTLKVKGKTYKATTNNKGKATFKIKNLKKKGTYKAVIKFKGNKNYKATSKKVKIKVKK